MSNKNFYITLISFFVLLSFFIIRNNFINKDIKEIKSLNGGEELVSDSKVDLSGPLRVTDDRYINSKDIFLDKIKVINLTNIYREKNGIKNSLTENILLDKMAEEKIRDMFSEQYFDHISPDNFGVTNLADFYNYEYIIVGENLAMGNFKNEEALVEAWMNSPGHRANILNDKYREIGVAVSKGVFEGKNVWMAVQHFGVLRGVCPKIDENLHNLIYEDRNKIELLENELSTKRIILEKDIERGRSKRSEIKEYNNDIDLYNNLIKETKEKINLYNKQVNSFNACVSSYK